MWAAVVIGVLMVLPALTGSSRHAKQVPEPGHATLGYPGATAAIVTTKDGIAYKLRLDAEPTVRGTVSSLVLVVQRVDAGVDAPNLLDPPGTWHGYQPYTFAATDFKAGAAQSLFGPSRTICRFASGVVVGIVVKQSTVEMVLPMTERRFTQLVLDVAIDAAPVVDGHPVCK